MSDVLAIPAIPVPIPCDKCGVKGHVDDERHAFYIVRSGIPKIVSFMLCPPCSAARFSGIRCRELGRDVVEQVFQHYRRVMEGS